jgi:cytochrome c-type biogenesis protein CcsB
MSDTTIISAVTFVYLAAFLFYLIRMLRGSERWGTIAAWIARAGFALQSAALLLRWKTSYDLGMGHAPLSNFYESLVFFSWSILLVHLIIEGRSKTHSLGTFLMPLAFLPLAYATISPAVSDRIQPLVPALQSNWLTIHVLTCFLGYAFFAAAFALGVMLLIKTGASAAPEGTFRRLIPAAEAVEELLYHAVLLGFVFLTLGIMTGSIWAHYAWGGLLELGPEGDLVADHVDRLRPDAPPAGHARLAGAADGLARAFGLRLCPLHLPGGELPRQPPQLFLRGREV